MSDPATATRLPAAGGTGIGLSFPTEAERVVVALNRCSDHAASAAALALEAATAPDEVRRAEAMRMTWALIKAYRTDLDSALTQKILTDHQPGRAEDIAAMRRLSDRLKALAATGEAPDREAAVRLSGEVRDAALPAIRNLSHSILVKAAADQNATLTAVHTRNKELERMFGDMDRIGRTIRLIAVNAAVEAARTGGESGRAFGVIATEVRALSTQAADLLSRARSHLQSCEDA